jgi:hypothetical protein
MKKARNCADCDHFRFVGTLQDACECSKGHRPRFYNPRSPNDPDWGWKRRCDDFKQKQDSK